MDEHCESHVPPVVVVPERLTRPGPAVVALRDDKQRLTFTPAVRARALRILQGLVTAAEAEGWQAESSVSARTQRGDRWDERDHLVINTGETRIGLRLVQEHDRTAHMPTKRELAERARWSWTAIPDWDYTPNDRIRIEMGGWSHGGRQYRWSDRQRWTLESQLGKVIVELRLRHDEAREERFKSERREAEAENRRREALAEAAIRMREAHLAEALRTQAAAWAESRLLTQYIDEMKVVIGDYPDDTRAEALAWATWAEEFAVSRDPLRRAVTMPDVPEPTMDVLRPFLPSRFGF